MREDLNPKIMAARKLAAEFADVFIPMDGYFSIACTHREPAEWSADGVHPDGAGKMLMAQKWVEAVVNARG